MGNYLSEKTLFSKIKRRDKPRHVSVETLPTESVGLTVLCETKRNETVLCEMVLCKMVLCETVLCEMVLCETVTQAPMRLNFSRWQPNPEN